MDWGLGCYEHVAAGLSPAARVVVEHAAPRPTDHVFDVGCGTGNAALMAAELGAKVTGIDPEERLLEVARGEAARRGLDASFVRGEAAALPFEPAAADIVLSVFGVIFAPNVAAAAGEMARVTGPHGRIVCSAWVPSGALFEWMKVRREALAVATGEPSPTPFPWHVRDAVADLLGLFGFAVRSFEHSLSFTDSSADDFVEAELRHHPLWVGCRAVLERRGEWQAVRERVARICDAANEDSTGFRLTTHYVVTVAERGSASAHVVR
jgi:SAM-dependent methyltransferase